MNDLNGFLILRLNQLSSIIHTEDAVIYQSFYKNVSDPKLREIFAIIHAGINDLFSFLNHKNAGNKHCNAHESRQLLNLIKEIKRLKAGLTAQYSSYTFDLDAHYHNVLQKCESFLSSSQGSTIPLDFPKINIIDYGPLFSFSSIVDIPDPKSSATPVEKKYIGSGSYATVHKYKDHYYDSDFAIKKAKDNLTVEELERFENEYKILKQLSSPFIVKAYQYNQKNKEYIMEYADRTLKDYINKNNNKLSFDNRRVLVIQLLNAFDYIHSKNIYHRDISYNNVLIKRYDDGSTWVKICDFGLVKHMESTLTKPGTEIKGTLNDISDLTRVGFGNYDVKHETYALAQVVYFILTGRVKNYERETNQILKNFITRALDPNINKRFLDVKEMKNYLIRQVFPSLKC